MKKTTVTALAALVSLALLTSSAFADSNSGKGNNGKKDNSGQQVEAKASVETAKSHDTEAKKNDMNGSDEVKASVSGEASDKQNKEAKKELKEALKQWKDEIKEAIKEAKEAAKVEDEDATVTEDTYGHNGHIGLQKAFEHVKNTPAGQVLAQLLKEKYGIDASQPEQAFSVLADELDAEGDTETAVDLQKELIKAEVNKLELYKKLGKMYEKLGKTGVKAFVNGEEPNFEVPPMIKDGSTLVPFRAISEALKAQVSWNPDEKSVTVMKNGIEVKLFIGDKTAYVNGNKVDLEVPGEIVDGSTMVPARFISESLKATVNWEEESQSVVIYEDNK